MTIELVETPLRFHLHGIAGVVDDVRFAEVGRGLMNKLWLALRGAGIPTTGINHWVYLPGGRMLVGVRFENPQFAPLPNRMEPLEFELPRYLKHSHIGPYQALPQKCKELKAALIAQGERIGSPSLEIYGHPCADPSRLETTILIGLEPKPA